MVVGVKGVPEGVWVKERRIKHVVQTDVKW
jgi:hypothetical protein